jgi:hypothetical protein
LATSSSQKRWLSTAVGLVAGALAPLPAGAQEIHLTGPLGGAPAVSRGYSASPGSKGADKFVLPSDQLEAGGEIVFLTSDAAGRQPELKLTDVGLTRLRARRALGDWAELFVATQLLVKQPEDWDEPLWQSVLGGVLVPFGHRLASSVHGGGGRLFGDDGWWWQVQPSLIAKPKIDRHVRFQLSVGHSITLLDFERDPRRFWLQEIVAHAETQLGDRDGALWLGIDYSLPVASGPDAADASGERFLDPNVRLGLQIGGVMTPSRGSWDLFVVYGIVDRGDRERPETTLPILDGGFDQNQLAIGVQHRFGAKSRDDE